MWQSSGSYPIVKQLRTRLKVCDPSTEGLERWIRTLLPACWYLVAQEAAKSCFGLRCGHHEALKGQD